MYFDYEVCMNDGSEEKMVGYGVLVMQDDSVGFDGGDAVCYWEKFGYILLSMNELLYLDPVTEVYASEAFHARQLFADLRYIALRCGLKLPSYEMLEASLKSQDDFTPLYGEISRNRAERMRPYLPQGIKR